jgi:anti-sigma factor RsiW
MNPLSVSEADLQAYVDDLLPHARRAEIEAYLALRPAEMERVHAYSRQNMALRTLFDPVLDEAVPPRLRRAPHHRAWPLQRLAAAVLIALAGGATGWVMHAAMPTGTMSAQSGPVPGYGSDALAHRAAVAHAVYTPEVRHPVEVGAEQEAHLVGWLSKRLGSPVHAPRLAILGYELIGGRLLPGNSGPVAQFMYQDGGGRRLTLYVSAEQAGNKESGFRFAQEGPVSVFYWIDARFGYALSANLTKGELARIAALVYEQLQRPS